MNDTLSSRMEEAVLATMLNEPGIIDEALSRLSPDEFSNDFNRNIYSAIGALRLEGRHIDHCALAAAMGDGYAPFIFSLTGERSLLNSPEGAEALREYINVLKERRYIGSMRELGARLSKTGSIEDTQAIIDDIEALRSHAPHAGECSTAELCDMWYAHIKEAPDYLYWGLPGLDRGLCASQGSFIILGGYPSAGKTALSLQFALEWAMRDKSVGFFTLETSRETIMQRLICRAGFIDLQHIKERCLSPQEESGILAAINTIKRYRLDIISAAGRDVDFIRSTALREKYDIIIIDYLQIVSSRHNHNTRYENITEISQDLASFARESGRTVVALSQLKRVDESLAKQPRPSMSSLRDSGQIEQDADIVLLLYPMDFKNSSCRRCLDCAKNKEGERSRIELEFNYRTQTFVQTGDRSSL